MNLAGTATSEKLGAARVLNTVQSSSVRDFFTLLKPGVMSLVVFTGFVGMVLAPGHLHPVLQLVTIGCIALGSGAGGAINMWFDRDIDAVMARTASRPVAAGRITPEDALAFGLLLALLSVTVMALAVGWLAAGILAFAIFYYAVIYTMWLKRATPQNIVIGGAAGAFPPVIGWAAVTGDVSLFAVVLFLIIFLWTPPHFWALALYRSGDYGKAGVPMLPVVAGKAATKRQMLYYTLVLLPVSVLPVVMGDAAVVYAVCSCVLGGLFVVHALRVMRDTTDSSARRMFGYSILYLFALFSALLADAAIVRLIQTV